jgi:integrase
VNLPKGVHRIISRGREFYYFQAGRCTTAQGPRTRLPNDPQSPEFWQALRAAQGVSAVEFADIVNAAIDGYLDSVRSSVSADTLKNYRRFLKPAREAWGALPIAGIRPVHVATIMKGLATTPGKANNFLATMKQLADWALTNDLITQSFVEGIKAYSLKGGHKPWTEEQIAAAKAGLTGVIRQGILIYLYTGQRGSDVVRLGPTHLDEGGFNLKQKKTGREVWCPIVPELAAEMATWPRRLGPYLAHAKGTYSRNSFWNKFDEQRENIPELAGVTLHGLRCTAVINLCRAGLSVPQISDIVGMSLATVQRYCRSPIARKAVRRR